LPRERQSQRSLREDARFILRGRRRDVFGHSSDAAPRQPSNFILNITLQEHIKRMTRLGLPIPVIEADFEEDDAAEDTEE
jgi:hypothetical protein